MIYLGACACVGIYTARHALSLSFWDIWVGGLSLILKILGHYFFCLVLFSSPSSDPNYMNISPFKIILQILDALFCFFLTFSSLFSSNFFWLIFILFHSSLNCVQSTDKPIRGILYLSAFSISPHFSCGSLSYSSCLPSEIPYDSAGMILDSYQK